MKWKDINKSKLMDVICFVAGPAILVFSWNYRHGSRSQITIENWLGVAFGIGLIALGFVVRSWGQTSKELTKTENEVEKPGNDFIKTNWKFLIVVFFLAIITFEIIQLKGDVKWACSSILVEFYKIESDVSSIQSDVRSIESDVSSIESDVSLIQIGGGG